MINRSCRSNNWQPLNISHTYFCIYMYIYIYVFIYLHSSVCGVKKNGKDDKLVRKLPYLYSKRFENTVEERESGLSRLIVESNVLPFFPHCPSDITHLSRKSVSIRSKQDRFKAGPKYNRVEIIEEKDWIGR